MKKITTIGLDLAKHVFQIHGADAEGSPVFNRKLRRAEVLRFFAKQPSCLVGLEACGSSHYWARQIAALGHDVRVIPPVYVKPFVKRGKTDAADAEAISEAVTRKTMRFVPIKSAEQQAAAMVLKTRSLLVRQQTQAINALRAHLSELGVITAIGTTKVSGLIDIVRDATDARLPKTARFALSTLADQIEALFAQIVKLEREIVAEAKRDEDMRRHYTRRRPDHGGVNQGACSRSRRVQIRSPLRSLAGINAEIPFERWQREVGRNIKDGQSRAPLLARPRRELCPATRPRQR